MVLVFVNTVTKNYLDINQEREIKTNSNTADYIISDKAMKLWYWALLVFIRITFLAPKVVISIINQSLQ